MCIKCKNRENAAQTLANFLDTTDALLDAFMLVERLKAKGATLDPDEQKVYDRLSRYVRAEDAPAEAAQPGTEATAVPEGLKEALQSVFPGATIIVGSPDEVEAMLDKTLNSGKKTH